MYICIWYPPNFKYYLVVFRFWHTFGVNPLGPIDTCEHVWQLYFRRWLAVCFTMNRYQKQCFFVNQFYWFAETQIFSFKKIILKMSIVFKPHCIKQRYIFFLLSPESGFQYYLRSCCKTAWDTSPFYHHVIFPWFIGFTNTPNPVLIGRLHIDFYERVWWFIVSLIKTHLTMRYVQFRFFIPGHENPLMFVQFWKSVIRFSLKLLQ